MNLYNLTIWISVVLFLNSCSTGSRLEKDGLKVIDLSSNNLAIVDSNGDFIVYPDIEFHCIKNGIVIGYRVDPGDDNGDGSASFSENIGHFELNIHTRQLAHDDKFNLRDVRTLCGYSNGDM